MAPIVGYWKLRGLVDPINFLLAHKEIAYEPKVYNIGPAPDFSKDEFRSTAGELGLDFPNLPYFIDGEVKLSQTLAILRYLARKNDLAPAGDDEMLRCDLAEQALMESLMFMFRCWRAHTEADQKEIGETLPAKLEQLNKFIGAGPYILGEKLSYPDFIMYTLLDYLRLYKVDLLENHSALKDFLAKFEALPTIDSYVKSDRFNRLPVTGIFYGWGGGQPEPVESAEPSTEAITEAAPAATEESPAEEAK